MITGLELVFISSLGLSAMQQPIHKVGLIDCEPQAMTKINVIWSTDKINYDHTKSMNQLSNFEIDTKSPYSKHAVTKVGGLMQGGLEVTTNVNVSQMKYQTLGVGCMWVNNIDIKINIHPTIYIATEYKKNSCMYSAVLQHEMKHIEVDRDIATKYRNHLRNMASNVTQKIGVVGPKDKFQMPKTHKKIIDYIESHMKQVTSRMYEERRIRQQGVDSLSEYEHVQGLCRKHTRR